MFDPAIFLDLMASLQKKCHQNSVDHGFWESHTVLANGETIAQKPNIGEKIALIHSELSEMLEAHRSGNPPCDKPITINRGDGVYLLNHLEEEAADVLIRLCDLCEHLGIDLGRVTLAKMQYNESRPHKHGKAY